MNSSSSEDKTCRMCGYADQSNLNIFRTKQIHTKILALYPIVLYKSDPLPKNVCLKCYGNILSRYDEYIRISKIQTKWINNVRNNQPNNPYIRVLDKIEETNKKLIENLRKLGDETLDQSFSIMKHNCNQFPEDITNSTPNNHQKFSNNNKGNIVEKIPNHSSNSILLRHLKGENVSNLDYKTSGYTSNNSTKFKINTSMTDCNKFPKNKCRYCLKVLPSQKYLAYHQVKYHLDLQVFNSFSKKSLPKRLRCGQLIRNNNQSFVRCKNCWKCFDKHDSILNHWRNKSCEFYCFLCGQNFASDPSLLRKHIEVQHSLLYKNYINLNKKYKKLQWLDSHPEPEHNNIETLQEDNLIPPENIEIEDNSNSLGVNFKNEPFEFMDIKDKPKIPVLKLKRKTNSEKDEFDIKIEDIDSNSQSYTKSPNSTSNKSETFEKPLLRVKDLSELQQNQEQPMDDDEEYIDLDEFQLNTINLETNDSCSEKENFLEGF